MQSYIKIPYQNDNKLNTNRSLNILRISSESRKLVAGGRYHTSPQGD